MLTEVMRSVNNHFAVNNSTGRYYFPPEHGEFKIEKGILSGVKNKPLIASYFAVAGSTVNNGVYAAADELITLPHAKNEVFTGVIYRLAVPGDFISLVKRIIVFCESKDGQESDVVSASFGSQSRTFAVNALGMKANWQDVYRQELHKYRRMRPDIEGV